MSIKKHLAAFAVALCSAATPWLTPPAAAQSLALFDFTQPTTASEWGPTHDMGPLSSDAAGLKISITGSDPYIFGPPRDYPVGQPLWCTVRLDSQAGGTGQIYYYRNAPSEPHSVKFPVRAGAWETCQVPLPPLGPGYHLRLDPPGAHGSVVVSGIRVSRRVILQDPVWLKPSVGPIGADALSVASGDVSIRIDPHTWQRFDVLVAGKLMAMGGSRPLIGVLANGKEQWLDLAHSDAVQAQKGATVTVTATARDAGGAAWTFVQTFTSRTTDPASPRDGVQVQTTVTVDQDRQVIYLPMLMIFPGLGAYGASKTQAILPGLEYLDGDEPSSSTKDLVGPQADRRVPPNEKVTFPMMALAADSRFVGITWQRSSEYCALFDAPDRTFHSGANVLGVLFPGADTASRADGSLLPYAPELVQANQPITLQATILGGRDDSAIGAVSQYVDLMPQPTIVKPAESVWEGMADDGWLHSGIRSGGLFHHAIPGSFGLQPAADAGMMMTWLAQHTRDKTLRSELTDAASQAVAAIPKGGWNDAHIGHIVTPAPALMFGDPLAASKQAQVQARDELQRLGPSFTIHYSAAPGRLDLSRTNGSDQANGLTAAVVASALQHASFAGDWNEIHDAIAALRALEKYDGTAPRGAQTWEVPLHTPDILAAAWLVKAFTLGYALTGDTTLLARAEYWAWTGIPFIYLDGDYKPVGMFATIPVFGASDWNAAYWLGVPVQWCGLVYADALYGLSQYSETWLWRLLADGITASGIQQTWPARSDPTRSGLLPDSYNLISQSRNNPGINPATVQMDAVRLYRETPIYSYHVFRDLGVIVHAAGSITKPGSSGSAITFQVDLWPNKPSALLVVGFRVRPTIHVDGRLLGADDPRVRVDAEGNRLALYLAGHHTISLEFAGDR
ncbi:MAG: hypothetical protein KGJ62_12925 [Armatimonadetes bacterium]|nr:hypothetical protein [Armatimonadota bacterium]MDE2206345.1 hypothetical protein [Armatimonadota bacterium]